MKDNSLEMIKSFLCDNWSKIEINSKDHSFSHGLNHTSENGFFVNKSHLLKFPSNYENSKNDRSYFFSEIYNYGKEIPVIITCIENNLYQWKNNEQIKIEYENISGFFYFYISNNGSYIYYCTKTNLIVENKEISNELILMKELKEKALLHNMIGILSMIRLFPSYSDFNRQVKKGIFFPHEMEFLNKNNFN